MNAFLRFLSALTAASGFLWACSDKIQPGTTDPSSGPEVVALLSKVDQATFPMKFTAVGTVRAQTEIVLSSKMMGTVQGVHCKEGDGVRAGDLLVELDQRQVAAEQQQVAASIEEARKAETAAISGLESARAEAERAQLQFARYRGFLEKEAVTRESFEAVQAQYRQARAGLVQSEAMVAAARHRTARAKAALEAIAISVKDTRITAPKDGVITTKRVEVGDLAMPGVPLVTLETAGYRVDLVVPEAHVHRLAVAQSIDVDIAAVGQEPLPSRVETIIPEADPTSRSFIVKLSLPDHPRLRSGMFATASIPIGERIVLQIPASAVIQEGQLTGVFVVDHEGVGRFRLIRVGETAGGMVEIVSGLNGGETIVVDPPLNMVDRSVVRKSQ